MKRAAIYLVTMTLVSVLLIACSKQSTTVRGSVVRGQQSGHIVTARAGQTLDVSVTSEEDNAVFQIQLPDEKGTLPGAGEMDDAKKFSGKVPTDGDYLIIVSPTRGNTTYRLAYSVK